MTTSEEEFQKSDYVHDDSGFCFQTDRDGLEVQY